MYSQQENELSRQLHATQAATRSDCIHAAVAERRSSQRRNLSRRWTDLIGRTCDAGVCSNR